MQISPHSDVDMWERGVLGRSERVLTFNKNLFGFETLVFAALQISSMHNQHPKDKGKIAT